MKATELTGRLILFGAAFRLSRTPRTECPKATSKSFTKAVEMNVLLTCSNFNSTP